jgi:hypothetical protein
MLLLCAVAGVRFRVKCKRSARLSTAHRPVDASPPHLFARFVHRPAPAHRLFPSAYLSCKLELKTGIVTHTGLCAVGCKRFGIKNILYISSRIKNIYSSWRRCDWNVRVWIQVVKMPVANKLPPLCPETWPRTSCNAGRRIGWHEGRGREMCVTLSACLYGPTSRRS